MPGFISKCLIIWKARKNLTAITFARYAAILRKKKRPKPVRYAARKGRCLKKLINTKSLGLYPAAESPQLPLGGECFLSIAGCRVLERSLRLL